jgi:hypothetical protein
MRTGIMGWLIPSRVEGASVADYDLEARHSIERDRIRGKRRQKGTIYVRCTLTVSRIILIPITTAFLAAPFKSRSRAISIENVSTSKGLYGSTVWTFTLVLQADNKDVRATSAFGRSLPHDQLAKLPNDMVTRFERALLNAWFRQAGPLNMPQRKRCAVEITS